MSFLFGVCEDCYLRTGKAGFKSKCTGLEDVSCPLTCATCPLVDNCLFAFDPYNTDGDCLDEK